MQKLRILNSRELKKIYELMKNQWGFDGKLDYVFLMSSKNRIFIANRDIDRIEDKGLYIDSMGLYFGELRNDELRLSIEASQIVGPKASNNILEIDAEQARLWLKGQDLDNETDLSGFVLVKHNNDFMGSGKVTEKKKIMNFVPKTRRILADD